MAIGTNSHVIAQEALAGVVDRESLFAFLRDELHWLVDPEDTFTYSGTQLSGDMATRVEVSQIVPFGAGDPFVIMLAEFETQFRRAELREVLRTIRAEMRTQGKYEGKSLDDIIFVCITKDPSGIRFAHFEQRDGKQPKLSSFGWETDQIEETRTLREFNLPALKMRLDLFNEPAWKEIRPIWLSAWDVERVTGEFFKTYSSIFARVENMIKGVKGDKRLFTQRLFNRLLFIQFLQKKRWLSFEGSTNYLSALFTAAKEKNENFYNDRLHWLFFYGLGTVNDCKETHEMDELRERRGEVPFLNGGLFEMEDWNDCRGHVQIHNDVFTLILDELFSKYNFTVTESTPDDVEVAVDPEMLGKIFEELVTGRHDTGSYYTPKPIVSFMCREALKGYLADAVESESAEAIALFVDKHDPSLLTNPERILEALRCVKACDPACGSGAYLLGLLHELIELRSCLFVAKNLDARTQYDKKLEIIQRNLYGVDIDPFAINIARLRLWLSLIVEYSAYPPPPLPNLDFKIEVGDSVVSPNPLGGVEPDMFRLKEIEGFLALKAEYMKAHDEHKPELRKQIAKQRKSLANLAHKGGKVDGFDWQVDFAEVFISKEALVTIGGAFNFGQELAERPKPGGFDIVLANPPYVRQELIKELKPALKGVYGDLFSGTADLYVYFYLRAFQLLRPGGMLVFISSNKWFKANYGAKLRKFVADGASVLSITDFGDLPVFEGATAYPMIFIARKGKTRQESNMFTHVNSLDEPYPDVPALIAECGQALSPDAFNGSNWVIANADTSAFLKKMESAGIPLGEYVKNRIFRGVLTGFNTAFVIDGAKRAELVALDKNSDEIIKPFTAGRDVRQWVVTPRDRWLIVTKIGVDISKYPAIFQHLLNWQTELETRADQGNHWWELRACGYYDAFDEAKIIYPDIAVGMRFAYDDGGVFTNNTAYFIAADDLFLLGLLNTELVERFYCELSAQVRGGYLRFFRQYVEQIPIPPSSSSERAAISALVQKCLDAKGVGCKEWEKEINERVAVLYGL